MNSNDTLNKYLGTAANDNSTPQKEKLSDVLHKVFSEGLVGEYTALNMAERIMDRVRYDMLGAEELEVVPTYEELVADSIQKELGNKECAKHVSEYLIEKERLIEQQNEKDLSIE